MTLTELYQALATLGLPVAYSHFPVGSAPQPPYIVYLHAFGSDLMADNTNYLGVGNYQVELYSKTKDATNETAIQTLLKSKGLPYRKTEAWLASEGLRQVVYEIQLIGG